MPDDSHTPTELDYTLQHIQAELARLDVLIGYELRRWQVAGGDPSKPFPGLHVSEEDAERLLLQPAGTGFGQSVRLAEEEEQAFVEAQTVAGQQVEAALDASRQDDIVPRFERLVKTFELDDFDRDVFLICLAPALERRYERLYGYLHDDVTQKWSSVSLILKLLCDPGVSRLARMRHFSDTSPLLRHRLIEQVAPPGDRSPSPVARAFRPTDTVVQWLLGTYQPDTQVREYCTLSVPERQDKDQIISREIWERFSGSANGQTVAAFYGRDQHAQDATARLVAAGLQRPLLRVDMAAITKTNISPQELQAILRRDARLTNAVLCLTGWDEYLHESDRQLVLHSLHTYSDLVIVCSRHQWLPEDAQREHSILWLEFPTPSYEQRLLLWKYFLAGTDTVEHVDLTSLAGQFELTTDQIQGAVATARDRAIQRDGRIDSEDLYAAVRAHSSSNLSSLARKIEPRYTWKDIVLPDEQWSMLRELVDTVRTRPTVLDSWGVGKKLTASRGVAALFAGPPGTGKTMAAEVIARALSLDLYKIDLSGVISKYIGETEKNLERIFDEAESSNAILFFDEADAIFGKRSEVRDSHDRYANIEVSYLLQRMEAYNGVSILATNLRANLDEAFTRRLHFAIDFPFPDETQRQQIWETLFPGDVPRASDIDFLILAQRFKLAGGNIRNIIVGAAHRAAADGGMVTMDHLLHSTRRELQKMGRLVNEHDLTLQVGRS